jgi:predicted O-methyltransferase YrrM
VKLPFGVLGPIRDRAQVAWWLARLSGSREPVARALAAALRYQPTREDRAIHASIEVARAQLLADHSTLQRSGANWRPDDGRTVADACMASSSAARASLLFALMRSWRPRRAVELGTNVGIGSAYIASGLHEGGRLLTVEGSPNRSSVAREWHRRLPLVNVDYSVGSFDEVLPRELPRIGPIDAAFIDGNHQYEPTLRYFGWILEHAAPSALVVFDDIRWDRTHGLPGKQMLQAWQEVRMHPAVAASVDLGNIGLCAVTRAGARRHLTSPLLRRLRPG